MLQLFSIVLLLPVVLCVEVGTPVKAVPVQGLLEPGQVFYGKVDKTMAMSRMQPEHLQHLSASTCVPVFTKKTFGETAVPPFIDEASCGPASCETGECKEIPWALKVLIPDPTGKVDPEHNTFEIVNTECVCFESHKQSS